MGSLQQAHNVVVNKPSMSFKCYILIYFIGCQLSDQLSRERLSSQSSSSASAISERSNSLSVTSPTSQWPTSPISEQITGTAPYMNLTTILDLIPTCYALAYRLLKSHLSCKHPAFLSAILH